MNGLGNLSTFGTIKRTCELVFDQTGLVTDHLLFSGTGVGDTSYGTMGSAGFPATQAFINPSFKHAYYASAVLHNRTTGHEPYSVTITYNGAQWEALIELFPQNCDKSAPSYSWLKVRSTGAGSPPAAIDMYYHSQGGPVVWWIGLFVNRALTTSDYLFTLNFACFSRCDNNVNFTSLTEECKAIPFIIYGTLESDDTELDGEIVPMRYMDYSHTYADLEAGLKGQWVGKTPNATRNRGMALLMTCKASGGGSDFDTWNLCVGSTTSAASAGTHAGGSDLYDVTPGDWSYYCNNTPGISSATPATFNSGNFKNDIGLASLSCASGAFTAVSNLDTLSGSGASIRVHLSE